MNDWISVEDKLPREGRDVLVNTKHGITIAHWMEEDDPRNEWQHHFYVQYDPDNSEYCYAVPDVLYWCPIWRPHE